MLAGGGCLVPAAGRDVVYFPLVSVNVVAPQEGFVADVAAVALALRRMHGQMAVIVALVGESLVADGTLQIDRLAALAQQRGPTTSSGSSHI